MRRARNLRVCVVAGLVAALLAGAPAYADEAAQPVEAEDVVAIADAESGPADAEADPAPEGVEAQVSPDEDEMTAVTDEPAGEAEPAADDPAAEEDPAEVPADDPDQLGSAADPDQLGAAALLRGTMGGVTWTVYADSSLVFAPTNGKSGTLAWDSDNPPSDYKSLLYANTSVSYAEDYPNYDTRLNIRTVRFAKGVKAGPSLEGLFAGLLYLESADLRGLDGSGATSVSALFTHCPRLKSVNLSGVNLSHVTDAIGMFEECVTLASVDLSGANLSGLKDATSMFDSCYTLRSLDLSALRGATLTNIKYMICGCYSLRTIDLSAVRVNPERRDSITFTSTDGALYWCPSLESFTVPESWPMEADEQFWSHTAWVTPRTIPDATAANGKWWSVKAKKWFTVEEIKTQRAGIADTYKNEDGSGKYATVLVYRMYNTKTSEHLYTTSGGEFYSCGLDAYKDWRREGVAWRAPKKSGTPVWRLYNRKSGDHHYTTSKGEKASLLATGDWRDEGAAFYSLAKGDADAIPLYRVYNRRLRRGQHHYTASAAERDALVAKHGWRDEHVGFYGYKWTGGKWFGIDNGGTYSGILW